MTEITEMTEVTNKQIAKELMAGRVTVMLNLWNFKDDPKAIDLNRGAITIAQFIERISESDPYTVIFLHTNNYLIQDRKLPVALDYYVSPLHIENIPKHYNDIKKAYPELSNYIENKPCASCGVVAHTRNLINSVIALGGRDRNIDSLEQVFGSLFIEKLKKIKNSKTVNVDRMLDEKPMPIPQSGKSKTLVRQCLNCTKEHVAKALGLLLEYHKDKKLYKTHLWRAIGQLGLAEAECIHLNNALSQGIREEKRQLIEDFNYIPDLEQFLQ